MKLISFVKSTSYFPVVVFFIIGAFSPSYASTAKFTETSDSLSTQEYGDLYVIERQEETRPKWKFSLGYGLQAGNPYFRTHQTTQTAEYQVSRSVRTGVQLAQFYAGESQLLQTLQSDLSAKNIRIRGDLPRYSMTGIVTLLPLSGHFMLFNWQQLRAELGLRGGIGYAQHPNQGELMASWSVRPSIYFTKTLSLQMGVGQEIDAPFTDRDSARFRTEFGLGIDL